jgi:hypothetical protein
MRILAAGEPGAVGSRVHHRSGARDSEARNPA